VYQAIDPDVAAGAMIDMPVVRLVDRMSRTVGLSSGLEDPSVVDVLGIRAAVDPYLTQKSAFMLKATNLMPAGTSNAWPTLDARTTPCT